jgi:hypothetical protein
MNQTNLQDERLISAVRKQAQATIRRDLPDKKCIWCDRFSGRKNYCESCQELFDNLKVELIRFKC